jgi:hypothetical protein
MCMLLYSIIRCYLYVDVWLREYKGICTIYIMDDNIIKIMDDNIISAISILSCKSPPIGWKCEIEKVFPI